MESNNTARRMRLRPDRMFIQSPQIIVEVKSDIVRSLFDEKVPFLC